MRHRVHVQARASATGISTSGAQPSWRETFSNKHNDSKGLANDPVLKVKNPDAGKREKAKKREQLVAPFHEADLGARLSGCQRKNRLSVLAFTSKVRDVWLVR